MPRPTTQTQGLQPMMLAMSLALTQPRNLGGGAAPSTAGQPIGLLLLLTKAS